jgi:hypothetical protein
MWRCNPLSQRTGEQVTWSDFGLENDHEEKVWRDDYRDVGPFEFEVSQYELVFANAVKQLKEPW